MADKTPVLGNGDERNRREGWRKSSYSLTNGHCLEAGITEGRLVGVRDSQAVAGPQLGIEPTAWTAFVMRLRIS
jgi:hypothetical protein